MNGRWVRLMAALFTIFMLGGCGVLDWLFGSLAGSGPAGGQSTGQLAGGGSDNAQGPQGGQGGSGSGSGSGSAAGEQTGGQTGGQTVARVRISGQVRMGSAAGSLTSAAPLTNTSPLAQVPPLLNSPPRSGVSGLAAVDPLVSSSALVGNSGGALIGNSGSGLVGNSGGSLAGNTPYRVAAEEDAGVLFVEAVAPARGELLARVKADPDGRYRMDLPARDKRQGVVIQATGVRGTAISSFLAAPLRIEPGSTLTADATVDITPGSTLVVLSQAVLAGVRQELDVRKGFRAFSSPDLGALIGLSASAPLDQAARALDRSSDLAVGAGADDLLDAVASASVVLARETADLSEAADGTFASLVGAQEAILGALAVTTAQPQTLSAAVAEAAESVTVAGVLERTAKVKAEASQAAVDGAPDAAKLAADNRPPPSRVEVLPAVGTLHGRAADDRTDPGFVTRLSISAVVTYSSGATDSDVIWTVSDRALGDVHDGVVESARDPAAGTLVVTATARRDGKTQGKAEFQILPIGRAEVTVQ